MQGNWASLKLDASLEKPLYQQLYEYLRQHILEGKMKADSKLPSKRKFAAQLGISQNTIQTAYGQLLEEGYIYAIEKSGFYVEKIEHLVHWKMESSAMPEGKKQIQPPMIDFSYYGVDREVNPFTIFKKLSKLAIEENGEAFLNRVEAKGYLGLRKAIATYLRFSRGINATAEQIVVSSGTEFLFQILFQILPEKSMYGMENPGPERLPNLFQNHRIQFCPLQVDREGIDTKELEGSGVDVLCITPSHQFPTGVIMPIKRRSALLSWAAQQEGRYIIEDDYDSEFKYKGMTIPALQGLDMNEKVIYMGSFSKSMSPALRISYMILPEHLLKEYHEKLAYLVCPVPLLDQKIMEQFMELGYFEKHLNRMRTKYKKKRSVLMKGLESLGDKITLLGADAGLHLVLAVHNGMTEKELMEKAAEFRVKVYGMSQYDIEEKKSGAASSPKILIGFASLSEGEIERGIESLKQAWFSNREQRG
ncbi:GntR family transcriptional regulator / MocR family aminotransferase [Tindallia magadiensis]|uniref:GntR family transcriptional regulator / MocR family aminotransferase n=1 Tax=Tindallia magadiensis TaxID=69895 RepID=A0A1I3EK14_9FIRM|nr:PLP-dependent aminotransferase family protein [Tindallia magadiensis]SFH99316.1 GntR family transcriptional regulator / MocR family aminotransferase [Tindallia magadiensis]